LQARGQYISFITIVFAKMLSTIVFSVVAVYSILFWLLLPIFKYFHDPKGLRKYPNHSFLSGITDIRYCYLSACGFRSRDLTKLHDKSPILRIGPNNLSFSGVDAIRDIYGHSTSCVKDLKYAITAGTHPNLFDVVDKPNHAAKRKRLSAAFAIKNLEGWEFKVARTTERLLAAFDKLCTKPLPSDSVPEPADLAVDFNQWVNLFTIEAINSIALSSDLGLLEKGNDLVTAQRTDGTTYQARYRKSQNQGAYATSHFVWDYQNFRLFVCLSKLFPRWRKVWNDAEPFKDIIQHQAVTRLDRYNKGEQLDDFFSALMDDKTGKPYNSEWGEIVGEIAAIIDAGADTTAIALTQILELLIHHPQHLATLREEVDSVLSPDDIVAPYGKIKHLPFLRACIDEALRIIPPTSAGLPRRTPPEGARILGEWIPGDTSVSMTIYTAHHDPTIFPNPDQYQPHRWMDLNERKRMEPYFIPFSTGARGCIGRNISYLEQTVVLASLVHRYEFALPSAEWKLQRFEAFNLLMGDMPIKLWRREIPA
jgi:benzoate 4-monooxygenase